MRPPDALHVRLQRVERAITNALEEGPGLPVDTLLEIRDVIRVALYRALAAYGCDGEASPERTVTKYRARFDCDSTHTWLTEDDTLSLDPRDAAVCPLGEIVNLVVSMALENLDAVNENGVWVLEYEQSRWVAE